MWGGVQEARAVVVVHLLGRLQQDAAEYLRIGGEGALAPLLRDHDARVRCAPAGLANL